MSNLQKLSREVLDAPMYEHDVYELPEPAETNIARSLLDYIVNVGWSAEAGSTIPYPTLSAETDNRYVWDQWAEYFESSRAGFVSCSQRHMPKAMKQYRHNYQEYLTFRISAPNIPDWLSNYLGADDAQISLKDMEKALRKVDMLLAQKDLAKIQNFAASIPFKNLSTKIAATILRGLYPAHKGIPGWSQIVEAARLAAKHHGKEANKLYAGL